MASSSSLGIGNNRFSAGVGIKKRCDVNRVSLSFVSIGDWNRSTVRKGRVTAVMTGKGEENRMIVEQGKNRGGTRDAAVDAQEKLDRWMKESVVDIVKNLKDAPLLVQVYSKKKGESKLATEKELVVDDWELVKERWENGETPMPEGVIFVEELGEDEAENGGERGLKERTTKVWGVVVQGKGVGCDPVCYLLKTSRVGSGPGTGMGVFSTHFCLVKVKNFRETAESQLKNCWLQKSHLLRK
ncbi:hypothetical protein TSUD_319590 [Trifolium subterraneum]|uniref:DUF7804 domain-containing protein n=1 Tax=Trifolium subterraneum TaxID=3900 RepID=A0A2Z6MGE3_TRISU|nr:hypothetical protein TSUD_319590 [Trifolium subterraneum]